MSDFIKFTGRTGSAYIRRDDVQGVSVVADGPIDISIRDGRMIRDVTDPLPVIEAALGYREHPAVAERDAAHTLLAEIRRALNAAGVPLLVPGDSDNATINMTHALIAEVTRLRADIAAVRDAERNTMARMREICAERDGLIRKLDAAQEGVPAPAPTTPKPGDIVTVEIARALPVGAVVAWFDMGRETRATKTDDDEWTAHRLDGDISGWSDASIGSAPPHSYLVSPPTPETPAETPADPRISKTLEHIGPTSREAADALPVGTLLGFASEEDAQGERPLTRKCADGKWRDEFGKGWACPPEALDPGHLVLSIPPDPKPEPKPEPAPTFTPAKVGDRWWDLTEAQIKALPEGTTIVVGALSKTLRSGSWFYDIGGQWAADNTRRGPHPDNRITHIPTPTRTPRDGDRLDSFTAAELEGLPVGARFVHPDEFAPDMVKKSDGWHKAGYKLNRPLDIGPDCNHHQDHGHRTLILPSPE